ncbi:MAG TPA: hypothetical protein VFJ43_17385 [Bacteroidia bacterium]|nr:hypothetical protein [Bacteroidia bacterium]
MHIEVQEPCHENWQNMSPQARKDSFGEKGRHCDKCCKTVFDFTEMRMGKPSINTSDTVK